MGKKSKKKEKEKEKKTQMSLVQKKITADVSTD